MRRLKWLLSFFSFLLAAVLYHENAIAEEQITPMARLQPLLGQWRMQVSTTNDNGQSWQDSAPVVVDVALAHRGKLITELPNQLQADSFNMVTYLTWDQYRQVYRKAAIDDTWGIMDIYEGNIVNNQLVMDNLRSDTSFPVAQDTWRHFRLTIALTAPDRVMLVEASDDKGKNWQPAFKVHYSPIKQ